MSNKYVFLVVGGDLRQSYVAQSLAEDAVVYTLGLDNKVEAENTIALDRLEDLKEKLDYVILPLPVTCDGIHINMPYYQEKVSLYTLIPYLKANAVLFGGKVDKEAAIFTYKGFEILDYLEREELSVLNAVPTSEGALELAMHELATTVYGLNVLVTGMGRISKVLIKALIGLGAKVTVTARKYADLEWAKIFGCEGIHIKDINDTLEKFDLIFNTVPFMIFDEKKLIKLKESCLVIDLASKPGGVDFDSASKIGVKVIWALSLPGKVAPVTSGQIIAGTIKNILSERGDI